MGTLRSARASFVSAIGSPSAATVTFTVADPSGASDITQFQVGDYLISMQDDQSWWRWRIVNIVSVIGSSMTADVVLDDGGPAGVTEYNNKIGLGQYSNPLRFPEDGAITEPTPVLGLGELPDGQRLGISGGAMVGMMNANQENELDNINEDLGRITVTRPGVGVVSSYGVFGLTDTQRGDNLNAALDDAIAGDIVFAPPGNYRIQQMWRDGVITDLADGTRCYWDGINGPLHVIDTAATFSIVGKGVIENTDVTAGGQRQAIFLSDMRDTLGAKGLDFGAINAKIQAKQVISRALSVVGVEVPNAGQIEFDIDSVEAHGITVRLTAADVSGRLGRVSSANLYPLSVESSSFPASFDLSIGSASGGGAFSPVQVVASNSNSVGSIRFGTVISPPSIRETSINQVGGINSAVTTIPVQSTAGFPAFGTVVIGSEAISYTSVSPTQFLGATRGAFGTAAVAHADGVSVGQPATAGAMVVNSPTIIVDAAYVESTAGPAAASPTVSVGVGATAKIGYLENKGANGIAATVNRMSVLDVNRCIGDIQVPFAYYPSGEAPAISVDSMSGKTRGGVFTSQVNRTTNPTLGAATNTATTTTITVTSTGGFAPSGMIFINTGAGEWIRYAAIVGNQFTGCVRAQPDPVTGASTTAVAHPNGSVVSQPVLQPVFFRKSYSGPRTNSIIPVGTNVFMTVEEDFDRLKDNLPEGGYGIFMSNNPAKSAANGLHRKDTLAGGLVQIARLSSGGDPQPNFVVLSSASASVALNSAATYARRYIRYVGVAPGTFTIATDLTAQWGENTEIVFEQANTGQVILAGSPGVSLLTAGGFQTRTSGQFAVISAKRVAANTWVIAGDRA